MPNFMKIFQLAHSLLEGIHIQRLLLHLLKHFYSVRDSIHQSFSEISGFGVGGQITEGPQGAGSKDSGPPLAKG
jgi:hypothetical protein